MLSEFKFKSYFLNIINFYDLGRTKLGAKPFKFFLSLV